MLPKILWYLNRCGSSFHLLHDQTLLQKKQQPLVHSKDLSEITAIKVSIPNLEKHPTSLLFNSLDDFEVTNGSEHLMEISFDHEPQGIIHDFRPELPLIFKY